MIEPSLSLDHFGVLVGDLDAGAERWHNLGFSLAPRSQQMGAVPGSPHMEPWATANHCAPLGRGYLELIGVVAPERFNPWRALLDRYQGFHILALRCDNADAAYPVLAGRVDGLNPPLSRQRDAPWRGGLRTMRFRNIFSRDSVWPECKLIVIEHQTPEVLWQKELMSHPNGAVALETVYFRAPYPGALVGRFAALASSVPVAVSEDEMCIPLPGGGSIVVMTSERFAAAFPSAVPPHGAAFVGVELSVTELGVTADHLDANGVAYSEAQDALWIAPEASGGGVIRFVETRAQIST